jgi:hypothetical protein
MFMLEKMIINVEAEQRRALHGLKSKLGIPVSEQIRRAINAWLKENWNVTGQVSQGRSVGNGAALGAAGGDGEEAAGCV